ncbi:MAG: M15 family metallopeptidase [Gammaproteobacteria bacterium]
MLFLFVALYFLLACFIAWLIFFPAGRETATKVASKAWSRTEGYYRRLKSSKNKRLYLLKSSANAFALSAGQVIKHHYLLFLAGAAIICLPPLFAWLISGRSMLDGFDVSTRDVNVQVADLLKGELLVPPMPLPPAVFTTQEVMQARPMLVGASRNWQLLNHDFMQRLLLIFKIMKQKHGYDMTILEGYRSPERQNMLASMGENVTNAAAFQSYHQYGLAADCAFLRDGKLVISEKDPWAMQGYKLYGEVAESVGMHWGGRWKMMDFGHLELRSPGVHLK